MDAFSSLGLLSWYLHEMTNCLRIKKKNLRKALSPNDIIWGPASSCTLSNRPLDILVMEPIYIPFLKKLLKQGGVQFLSLATAIITHASNPPCLPQTHTSKTLLTDQRDHTDFCPKCKFTSCPPICHHYFCEFCCTVDCQNLAFHAMIRKRTFQIVLNGSGWQGQVDGKDKMLT